MNHFVVLLALTTVKISCFVSAEMPEWAKKLKQFLPNNLGIVIRQDTATFHFFPRFFLPSPLRNPIRKRTYNYLSGITSTADEGRRRRPRFARRPPVKGGEVAWGGRLDCCASRRHFPGGNGHVKKCWSADLSVRLHHPSWEGNALILQTTIFTEATPLLHEVLSNQMEPSDGPAAR